MAATIEREWVLRPMQDDDEQRLVRFHEDLDGHSQYLRFFTAHPHLSAEEVERFTHVDHDHREALVAVVDDEIIGVGRYDRLGAGSARAEIAFVVAGAWRGRGIATTMLHCLADHARSQGITTFIAETLTANQAMRTVFRKSGYPGTDRYVDGAIETVIDITSCPS